MKSTSSGQKKPSLAARTRRWHRILSLVLVTQLAIWVVTAFGMAMVPRESTTAYRMTPAKVADLAARWPDTEALRAQLGNAGGNDAAIVELTLQREGLRDVLTAHREKGEPRFLDPATLSSLAPLTADEIASHVTAAIGEPIGADDVTVMDEHSLGYPKRSLPVWRVEAQEAELFFAPETAAYVGQATAAKRFENLMKTIHTMDYSGSGRFRGNLLLTAAAVLFLATALMGALSVRRIAILGKGKSRGAGRWYRWHQVLGVLLLIQVFFWTSSGLGVVWFLDHPQFTGEGHAKGARGGIDWSRVNVHPRGLKTGLEAIDSIELASLLGQPVYRLAGAGRAAKQELWDAESGQPIELTIAMRDAIVNDALLAPESIERWERADSFRDIDYYFYTGPFPAWKAHYSEPYSGVMAIDAVTGKVHGDVRTRREVGLEKFYKTHVVYWESGVIRYRREPVLLAVLTLAALLVITGAGFQIHRWRLARARSSRKRQDG